MSNGHGGRRTGAGRKPKTALERAIDGNAGRRGVVLQHPNSTAVAAVEVFDPPAGLTRAVLAVWHELAPHAFAARTLTPATTAAFAMLCRAIAKERVLSSSRLSAGGSDHRGMMSRVSTGMKDFGLGPLGKPMYVAQPEQPVSKLDRYMKKARA